MPAFCSCASNIANTGAPNSQNLIDIGVKLIVVNLFADDGTQNSILSSDTLDSAYITAKLNNADKTKRWFPLGSFVNVEETRADPNAEEFTDGSQSITRIGRRSWSGKLLSHSSRYLAKMEGLFCQKFGLYTVDNCGNLVGRMSADGTKLFPITVNQSSWSSILMKGTFTESAGINLAFDFAQTMKDKDLRQINASDISVDLLDVEGLRDVNTVISAESTTGFVATLTLPFDEFLNAAPVATGWLLADFVLYNETDASSVVITTVTETGSTGVYTFVIPTQDSADVLSLTAVKNGFDLGTVTVTIP